MPSVSDDSSRSLLTDALRSVTHFVARRPQSTLWLVLVFSAICLVYTVNCLRFKTDRSDLIDPAAPFHQRWLSYTESFGESSDIVVVVEAGDPETIKQVLDRLGARLEQDDELFKNVLYKIDPGSLPDKGLQYLPPEQLEAGLDRLADYRPVLNGHWERIRLEQLVPRLNYQLGRQPAEDQRETSALRHAHSLAVSLDRFLADRSDFRSPWPEVLPIDSGLRESAHRVIHLINEDGTMGLLQVVPAQPSGGFPGSSHAIARVRKLMAEVGREFPQARLGLTGIPVLESDEMDRSRSDMLRASLISCLGVAVVLLIGFRGFRHPMLALTMLGVAMAWAFGYTTFAVGHLNILSVSFAAILIGLGIDFAIHYLARYLQLRHEGRPLRPALLETSAGIGTGIVTTAITTALAFYCATFTQFLGVAELGVIAGGGILLSGAAAFLVLPALVALADRHVEPKKLPTPFQGSLLRLVTLRHPWLVLGVSLCGIAGVGCQTLDWHAGRIAARVRYDHNLLNLQAEGLESVAVQKRIFKGFRHSLLFAVSLADSPEEARRLKREFEALPSVHHVEELASRLPAYSENRTKLLVQAYHVQLAGLPERIEPTTTINPVKVGTSLESLYRTLRKHPHPRAAEAEAAVNRLLNRFERLSAREQATLLVEFQARMDATFLGQLKGLAAAANPDPVELADFPPALTSRFVSSRGQWLLQVFPREQVWDMDPLGRFVDDVRSVDPEVTGTPLQNFEAAQQIKESYENAAQYALVVICLVLLVDFMRREHVLLTLMPPLIVISAAALILHTKRQELDVPLMLFAYAGMALAIAVLLDLKSVVSTLLAILPPVGGMAMMFGLLAAFQVDLNPANLIVLPLILGIGVDDGVHVMHDYCAQTGRRYRTSSSTINAIVLTSLTSMIGFGSMMVAAHRGLYSLGFVLFIGVGSCLFVSLVTLPAVLTLMSRPGRRRRTPQRGSGRPREEAPPKARAA